MGKRIDTRSAAVFASLGWTVAPTGVTLAERIADGRTLVRHVSGDGSWRLTDGGTVLASGQEGHPCTAACDANEAFWKLRALAREG